MPRQKLRDVYTRPQLNKNLVANEPIFCQTWNADRRNAWRAWLCCAGRRHGRSSRLRHDRRPGGRWRCHPACGNRANSNRLRRWPELASRAPRTTGCRLIDLFNDDLRRSTPANRHILAYIRWQKHPRIDNQSTRKTRPSQATTPIRPDNIPTSVAAKLRGFRDVSRQAVCQNRHGCTGRVHDDQNAREDQNMPGHSYCLQVQHARPQLLE